MSAARDAHGLSSFARKNRMLGMSQAALRSTVRNASRVFIENMMSVGLSEAEAEKALDQELWRIGRMYNPWEEV